MTIEAIVLTGGQSRRMGQDKAKLPISGVPQAERIVRQFVDANITVTVLGREAVAGAGFLKDQSEFDGPIAALSAYQPQADLVFVASCDLPQFDIKLVDFLKQRIGVADACAPEVDGFRQPLCALYAARAFRNLESLEDQCAMGWLRSLVAVTVQEQELQAAGLKPAAARGANTPDELAKALEEAKN